MRPEAWAVNAALVAALLVLELSWPLMARFAFAALVLTLAVNGVALYCLCASPWELPAVVLTVYCNALFVFAGYVARGCTPLFPEWSLVYELSQGLLHCCLENYGTDVVKPHNAACLERLLKFAATQAFAATLRGNGTTLERVQINNLEHLWIKSVEDTRSSSNPKKTRIVLLYYHGGGYATFTPYAYIGLASLLRADMLKVLKKRLPKQEFTVDVLLAKYRKSGTHPFPVPSQDAYLTYAYLLKHEKLSSKQVVLAGDSAGGGLAMSAMLRARDNGTALPLAAALLHPYVDMTGDDVDHPNCIIHSTFLSACRAQFLKNVVDDSPKGWKDASAVHCDLRNLPPAIIVTSDFDLLRAQAQRLKDKADADGLNWELDFHKNMPHVFMLTPPSILPQTAVGSAHVSAFLVERIVQAHGQV